MEKVKMVLTYVVAGMPVWVWLLMMGLGALNEWVNRSKSTEAQTLLQGAAKFVLKIPAIGSLLARFPLLGDVLVKMATPPQPQPAAAPAKVA